MCCHCEHTGCPQTRINIYKLYKRNICSFFFSTKIKQCAILDIFTIGGRQLEMGDEHEGIVHLFNKMPVEFDGILTRWEYFAASATRFSATIWREVSTGVYRIVAKTVLEPTASGSFVCIIGSFVRLLILCIFSYK